MSVFLNPKTYLSWSDYLFVLLVLAVCTALGWYFKQKKNEVKVTEFILASRNLSLIPSAVSFAATAVSAYAMSGVTGEMYLYGIQYIVNYLAAFGGLVVGAFVFIPKYRASKYVTAFQMMEERFDSFVRKVFSFAYIIQKVMFLSIVLHVTALSLSTLTDFDYKFATVAMGFVCTVYSSLGGLRAVIWTDIIQFALMFATMLMVIFEGAVRVENLGELWTKSIESGYLTTFDWIEDSNSRYSICSLVLTGLIFPIDFLLLNQAYVQRVLGARSDSAAKWAVIIGAFLQYCLMPVITVVAGAVLYGMYSECDPGLFPNYTGVTRIDQIFVYAIGDLFMNYPVLKGVAISGITSASLSTLSSFLNSFAAVALEDFVKPIFPNLVRTERRAVLFCMLSTFVFGIIMTFSSFLVPLVGNAVFALGIVNGILRGQTAGSAFLVFFYKRLTKKACLLSLSFGMIFNSWIIAGSYSYVGSKIYPTLPHSSAGCDSEVMRLNPETGNITFTIPAFTLVKLNFTPAIEPLVTKEGIFMPLYHLPWIWYGPVGFLVTVIAGIILSEISIARKGMAQRARRRSARYVNISTHDNIAKMTKEAIELA